MVAEVQPEHLRALESAAASELQERDDLIHLCILSLIGRLNAFFLGPPGVSKSYGVTRVIKRIDGLGEDGFFHINLDRFTRDDQIFGPPHVGKLQTVYSPEGELLQEGRIQRDTRMKLPRAKIAFFDEIWEASSALSNTLLLAANEGLYRDEVKGLVELDLFTILSASNSMPDTRLRAIWDRMHFRLVVDPLRDKNARRKMLLDARNPAPKNPEPVVHIDQIEQAQEQVEAMHIPDSLVDAVLGLWDAVEKEGVSPSDRRFVQTLSAIKAEAWLRGAQQCEIEHTAPLQWMLWDRPEDYGVTMAATLDLTDPHERMARESLQKLSDIEVKYEQLCRDVDPGDLRVQMSTDHYNKLVRLHEKARPLREAARQEDASLTVKKLTSEFEQRFKLLSRRVLGEVGVDDDLMPNIERRHGTS